MYKIKSNISLTYISLYYSRFFLYQAEIKAVVGLFIFEYNQYHYCNHIPYYHLILVLLMCILIVTNWKYKSVIIIQIAVSW